MTALSKPDHPYEQNERNDLNFCKCGKAKTLHMTKTNTEVVEELKKWMQKEIVWDYDTTYGAFLEEKEVEEALIKRDQAKDTQATEMMREVMKHIDSERDLSSAKRYWFQKGIKTIAQKYGIDLNSDKK